MTRAIIVSAAKRPRTLKRLGNHEAAASAAVSITATQCAVVKNQRLPDGDMYKCAQVCLSCLPGERCTDAGSMVNPNFCFRYPFSNQATIRPSQEIPCTYSELVSLSQQSSQ